MAGQKLRGLVGQGMSGRRSVDNPIDVVGIIDATSGSSTFVAPKKCIAHVFVFGGGASGAVGGSNGGGGGGAACYQRIRLVRGGEISYSVGVGGIGVSSTSDGVNGGDSIVTLPNSTVLFAGGGKKGTNLGGAGGIASGGAINRAGGAGGNQGLPGANGDIGGGVGGGTVIQGGGGGAAGFSDIALTLVGGAGSSGSITLSLAGSSPGGGSGAGATGNSSGSGGGGRVYILAVRAGN